MGVPIWGLLVVIVLFALGVAFLVVGRGTTAGAPCPKCKHVMLPEWTVCMFCGTHPGLFAGQLGKLHFVTGAFAGRALVLEKAVTTIGSAAGNDVVLQDTGVSRRHVGFRRLPAEAGGGYEVADLGSTNAVTINGEKKPKKALAVGDIIRVGSTEMIFRV